MTVGEMDRKQRLRIEIDGEIVEDRVWSRKEAQVYVEEEYPEAWYGGHGTTYRILAEGDS